MDDLGVGRLARVVRIRRGLRQSDVARQAGVSRQQVSRVERGHLGELRLGDIRAICATLDIRVPLAPAYRGGDADRIVNEAHTALANQVIALLTGCGWQCSPEVTYSIYGERGSIDILAWHAPTRTLLLVEIKTELVDPAGLAAQVDKYMRLAPRIAAERGWDAASVSAWVVVADTSMNRRRLAKAAELLRARFPSDGRAARGWIRDPRGRLIALGFLSISPSRGTTRVPATLRRVRSRPVASGARSWSLNPRDCSRWER